MFYFQNTQKKFNIKSWEIGGQPGENPTILFGGVRKLSNENYEEIKGLLKGQEILSSEFGVPASIDLFIRKPEHIRERIDFVSENTSYPFLLDLPFKQIELKREVLEYIDGKKLQDRVIYNSINFATSEEEMQLIKKYEINSAILLAVDMANLGTDGSLSLLEKKLIPIADEAGVVNRLVDPGTMAFNNDNAAGEVFRSIMAIKSETGLPAGCAMINLAESWEYFKTRKEKGYIETIASLNSSAQMMGANFIIYGPLDIHEHVIPPAAVIDRTCAEANKRYFGMESKIKK